MAESFGQECVVCLEVYDTKCKVPKILSCGHTCCLQCLKTLSRSATKIVCPTCRQETVVPGEGVGNLISNYGLLGNSESVIACQECDQKPGKEICRHCDQKLCQPCKMTHSKEYHRQILISINKLRSDVKRLQDDIFDDSDLVLLRERAESANSTVKTKFAEYHKILEKEEGEILSKIKDVQTKERDAYATWKTNIDSQLTSAKQLLSDIPFTIGKTLTDDVTDEILIKTDRQCKQLTNSVAQCESSKPAMFDYILSSNQEFEELIQKSGHIMPFKTMHVPTSDYTVTNPEADGKSSKPNGKPDYPKANVVQSFGSKGSSPGQFLRPYGVCTTPTGGVIVTDSDNHMISVLTGNLQMVTRFGSKGKTDGFFDFPKGVGVSSQGDVFICDYNNHRLQVTSGQGRFLYKFPCVSSTGQSYRPNDLVIHADELFLAADGIKQIFVFNLRGTLVREICKTLMSLPWFITVKAGQLCVSDDCGRLHMFKTNGQNMWTVKRNQNSSFNWARGAAFDRHGNIIVSASTGRKDKGSVFILNEAGTPMFEVPQQHAGRLTWPNCVDALPDGSAFLVCDTGSSQILKFEVPSVS